MSENKKRTFAESLEAVEKKGIRGHVIIDPAGKKELSQHIDTMLSMYDAVGDTMDHLEGLGEMKLALLKLKDTIALKPEESGMDVSLVELTLIDTIMVGCGQPSQLMPKLGEMLERKKGESQMVQSVEGNETIH